MHRLARRFALAITLTLVFAVRAKSLTEGHLEAERAAAPAMSAALLNAAPLKASPLKAAAVQVAAVQVAAVRVAAVQVAAARARKAFSADLPSSGLKKRTRSHVGCMPLGFGCLQNS